MVTVLAVYNSSKCIGRCDSRCYSARNAKCHCICDGRNHSSGKERAMENVREMVGLKPEDLQKFAEAHKLDARDLAVVNRIETPSNRRARKIAKYKIEQPELPL